MTQPAPDWPALIAAAERLLRDLRRAAAATPEPERPVGIPPDCPRHRGHPAGRCTPCEITAEPPPKTLRRNRTRETT